MTRAAFYLLAFSFLLSATACARGNGWERAADAPEAKANAAGAIVGNDFYFLGGWAANRPSNTCYKLDLIGNRWMRIADLPAQAGFENGGVTTFQGKIYLVGGTERDGTGAATSFVYNPEVDRWAEAKNLALPSRMSFAGLAPSQNGLCLIAGSTANKSSKALYWADPSSNRGWQELPVTLNHARQGALAQTDSLGRIWIAGDQSRSAGCVEIIEPDLSITDLPNTQTVVGACCFTVGSSCYLVGGAEKDSSRLIGRSQVVRGLSGFLLRTTNPAFAGNDCWLVKCGGYARNRATTETEVFYAAPAPLARPDEYTAAGGKLTISGAGVLANDEAAKGDCVAELSKRPEHGMVTLNRDGSFVYLAESGFKGLDTFTYLAKSRAGTSDPCLVTVHVK